MNGARIIGQRHWKEVARNSLGRWNPHVDSLSEVGRGLPKAIRLETEPVPLQMFTNEVMA